MTKLIEINNVDKHFPGVYALKKVCFDLNAGEVHALMGENGAGKSTLMKILSGVYHRDSGSISLNGVEIHPTTPRAAQDLGISIIHQELSLMNDLGAAQNIFIGREPRNRLGLLDEKALNHQASEIFTRMNLNLDPTTLVADLTIAKQQMVEIAKALSFKSKVLIMDEPTAALNEAETTDLFTIIKQLKSEGVGIIYISHKMDELKQIADRVTVMRDGEYVGTKEAKNTPISDIITMMVGREIENTHTNIPKLSQVKPALEVSNLNRGSDIRHISFEVRQGEILGFAGLMGSGRTEVARAIFGADKIDSGSVKVHGKICRIRSPYDAVHAGIGYLSEDRKRFGLATTLDVRTNIAISSLKRFSSLLGVIDEKSLQITAQESIEKLAIRTPSDQQEVRFLSGGNQQKVVVAKWLLRHCDILIFDEPTRGIDVGAKAEIYKLLEQLIAQGRAIIVISSELPEIMRLSHRIAVMCEGRLTGILPGGQKTTQEDIMHLATQREEAYT